MTSNPKGTAYSFSITSSDLVKGNLNRPGKVRVDKIYTLSQSMVAKTFGRVDAATLDRVRRMLEDLVATKPRPTVEDE
jgi:mRNA-degrading endonuclease toxin of MazEF toxin-antitoxin module